MTELKGPLLLVGGGKMGGAMLRGWLKAGLAPRDAAVVDPVAAPLAAEAKQGVVICDTPDALPKDFKPRVVVLAVKPQMMAGALPSYRRFATPGTLILSVAAGKTLGYFERGLGDKVAIVRSMPNTPAAVGRGITVCCANAHCSAADRELATALLAAVGEVHWVDDERLIDAVTAVSGGGPAYVFLLIECLAKAGEAAGLPAELAMRLARVSIGCSASSPIRILSASSVVPFGLVTFWRRVAAGSSERRASSPDPDTVTRARRIASSAGRPASSPAFARHSISRNT